MARHRLRSAPVTPRRAAHVSSELEATVQRALAKVPARPVRDRGGIRRGDGGRGGGFLRHLGETPRDWPPPGDAGDTGARLWVGALRGRAEWWRCWWVRHSPNAAPDRNKVMVFPLVHTPGPRSPPRGRGEAVAIMIGSAFERSEPLKWIRRVDLGFLRPSAMIHVPWIERDGRGRLSLRQQARYFVDGWMVVVDGDSAAPSCCGSTTRWATPCFCAAARLGQQTSARCSRLQVAGLESACSPALDQVRSSSRPETCPLSWGRGGRIRSPDWLQGGSGICRRARFFKDALDHFERAVDADSALALPPSAGRPPPIGRKEATRRPSW